MKNLKKAINGYKKIIIVCIVVLLSAISVYAATENGLSSNSSDENPLDSFEYSEVTFTDNSGLSSGFTYNDGMMLTDANELSSDLAKVSVCLADAAYKESVVKSCISDMQYTLVDGTTYNYNKTATYDDNDFVAYSIAHKEISYKGETYNSYLVIVRGTTGNCEWFSNFHLGNRDDGYHDGFKKAADEILTTISHRITTSNNIFLVTGHSRGAAVANIVAGELTANSMYNSLASQNHIFGYTYACPAVSDQLTSSDLALNNIRNYNNPGDAIPELPLHDWGYNRYGQSLSLSTDKDVYENFKQRFETEDNETYGGILHTDSFVSTLKTIADEKSAYNNADNQLLFDIAGWYLGGKSNTSIQEVLSHHNVPIVLATALINITSDMVVSGIQDSIDSNYNDNLDFLTSIDLALENTVNLSDDEFNSWCLSNQTLLQKISTEIEVDVKTRNDLVSVRTKLKDGMDDVAYTTTNLATILSLWYSTNGNPKDAIFHAHTPETYVLWGNSMFYGYEGWKNYKCESLIDIDGVYSINTIGVSCFENAAIDITDVSKVRYIGECAFYGDKYLSTIDLSNIRCMGGMAFKNTSGLRKVTVPVDLTYAPCGKLNDSSYGYFAGTGVEEIHYTKGNTGVMPDRESPLVDTSYENASILTLEYGARGTLKKVMYDEGITRIGDYAYYGSSVETADFPSTVSEIGSYAFAYCEYMSAVVPKELEVVGDYAFYSCPKLTGKVTLGEHTETIGFQAFLGTGITELEIKNADTVLGGMAFKNTSDLRKVTVPIDLTYAPCGRVNDSSNGYFAGTGVEEIHYTKGNTGVMPDRESPSVDTSYENASILTLEYGAGGTLKKVTYDEGITRIGDYAYYGSSVKIVDFPSTVSEIGSYAFAYCSLTEIEFPESIKKIEDYTFSECTDMVATVPCGLEKIGDGAFSGCTKLTGKLTIDEKLNAVGFQAFLGTGITELEIKNADTVLGGMAFKNTSGLRKVTVPVDLTYAPCGKLNDSSYGYFAGTGVEEIHYTKGNTGVMPDRESSSVDTSYENASILTLEYGAGGTLKKVTYDEGITRIGDYAYYGSSVETVDFSSTVSEIGSNAFAYCEYMSAVVPKELEVVGDYAFYSCPKLTGKVTLGEHTETIGFQAFLGTGITELEIKNADTVLGGMAFKNTSGLRKVTVPVDLTYAPCGKLNDSSYGYFAGTGVEEIHYTKGNTGVMPDRESPSVDTSYENASILTLEYGAGGTLKKVTYDEGITRIGDYAYNSNTAITDVLFAKSIEIIGTNNFNSVTKDNVKFYGHKDSYAETYANDLGVDFVPLFYPIITTGANEFLAGEEYTFEARTYSGIDQFTTDVSWAVDGQKSDKTVIDKNGLLKIASDESADSITVIADNGTNRSTFEAKIKQHTHEYSSEPIFHWTEDYTACDAVVKCQECNTEKNYTCTVTKTEENPTCSKEGKITYTATVTISDKEYTDIKEISQEKTDHTVVNMEGKTPTCTEEGLTEGSYCSECGEIIKQQRSIDALGHDLVKVDAVEPTEEMSGNIEYYMCNRCGKYFSDSDGEEETSLEELTLPAYGERHEHNWIEANRQEPTCTKTGLVIYTCQCGKQKEEVLNPLNHLIQVDKAISPTCTRNGLTEGSHCSVCNTIITPQKEIAAWGHKFTTTTTKATTNKDGSIVKKCTVCGHVDSMTTIYYPKTIILSGTSFVYSGKVQKPGITVVGSNGKIIPDSNYSIIYSSGCKNVGNYTLKIVFKNNYSGSVSKAYMIVPKGSSIKSLKAGSKKFTVKWTKQARQTTGYQLQYSTNSKFTKVKTVTIGKNSTVSKAISKLAGRKKYYVRIRTYTTVTGRKYYSAWSKTKSVVTKK